MSSPQDLPDWTLATSAADTPLANNVVINPGATLTLDVAAYQSIYVSIATAIGSNPPWLTVIWSEDPLADTVISQDNLSAPTTKAYTGQLAVAGPYVTFVNNLPTTRVGIIAYGSTHVAVPARAIIAQDTFEGESVTTAITAAVTPIPLLGVYQGLLDFRCAITTATRTGQLEFVTRSGILVIVEVVDFVAATFGSVARVQRAVPATFGSWQWRVQSGATPYNVIVQTVMAGPPY